MTDWKPVFLLPNISLKSEIGCDIVALAPPSDARVIALSEAYPKFGEFLCRFTDNFGKKLKPITIIVNRKCSSRFHDVSALASFRDIVALAVILHSRSLEMQYPHQNRILFGDSFSIYPWAISHDYERLIGNTPAILGAEDSSNFNGQSSPYIFCKLVDESHIDEPLMSALLSRWRVHYESEGGDWESAALMRSLNMAYHASLTPSGTEVTIYDVGRIISLWISAFEILAHPGEGGISNRDKVIELIERTSWKNSGCSNRIYNFEKESKKLTLASFLYCLLHKCRNDFLHGNPVTGASLRFNSDKSLFDYAALLYRFALSAFLQLEFNRPLSERSDPESFAEYCSDLMDFDYYQCVAENALLTAVNTELSNHDA